MYRSNYLLSYFVLVICVLSLSSQPALADTDHRDGKRIFNYYCYQCHGYAGDAQTLASSYLDPKPRDFSHTSLAALSRQAMLEAVQHGRAGTAMKSFARLLSDAEIVQVVGYIRSNFMALGSSDARYHTAANGWPDHQRYAAAFPFVSGTIPLATAWEKLDPKAVWGKRLYLSACISCHDHARSVAAEPIWTLHAVSYPSEQYDYVEAHDGDDEAAVDSTYLMHQSPPVIAQMTPQQRRGESIYQDNCILCHAADGSGRNWRGSFLQPRPSDLASIDVAMLSTQQLRQLIQQGRAGTSMPSWKSVLSENQIDDLMAYIQRAFIPTEKPLIATDTKAINQMTEALNWRRQTWNNVTDSR